MSDPWGLEGATVAITGASTGIGAALTDAFLDSGAIVLGISRTPDKHPTTSPNYRTYAADLSVRSETEALIDTLKADHERIDVLINNAGLGGSKRVVDMTDDEWNKVLDVTLTGTFRMTRAMLKKMQPRGRGAIVNNASVLGWRAQREQAHYAAAKAGVIGLAKGLARELLPSDITVNCIAPSMAMTDLLDGMSAEYIAYKKSRIPMGRLCTPEEIANVAAFIASPACSFTTGQVFDVTGGRATW
jgi:NAD(P)-dependent dehydrogenase (short-subunit alcohol dehydrogenase family)